MQKIRKILWPNSEKKSYLLTYWPTDLLTDGANFIGPFHFRGGPKKDFLDKYVVTNWLTEKPIH